MIDPLDLLPIITRQDGRPGADGTPAPEGYAILVDKPGGITSFGVIRKLRWALGVKKMGHAGTLDPMATGLLIVLVGRKATRLQDRFMGQPKVYTGTLRLGETTASYDADTPVLESTPADHITDADLDAIRGRFIGEIEQTPPIYSALKVGGERLYKKARRGESVEIRARTVTVSRFEWTDRRGNDVDFRIDCSKGTYIRSLAHDAGQALGVGAHLTALRREATGAFRVDDAFSLAALAEGKESAERKEGLEGE